MESNNHPCICKTEFFIKYDNCSRIPERILLDGLIEGELIEASLHQDGTIHVEVTKEQYAILMSQT